MPHPASAFAKPHYDKGMLLREPYSDHTMVKGNFQVSSGAQFRVASYNMSNQCIDDKRQAYDAANLPILGQFLEVGPTGDPFFANNPYNIRESDEEYEKRLSFQLDYLQQQIDEGVDILNLQEVGGLSWRDKTGAYHRHPQFEAFLARNNLGCVISIEDKATSPANRVKNVITVYRKSKFNLKESHIALPSPQAAGSTFVMNHGLFSTFVDASGQEIMIGNVHLDYKHDATPEIHSIQAAAAARDVACITCGDMNRPADYVHGAFTNFQATCHDNPDKEMVGGATSFQGNDYRRQSITHGETAAMRSEGTLKTYDFFLPHAPQSKDLHAQTLSHQVVVQASADDVGFAAYKPGPIVKIAAGTAHNQPARNAARAAAVAHTPAVPAPGGAPTAKAAANLSDGDVMAKLADAIANHIKAGKALDAAISRPYEAALATQQDIFKPTKAYRGIGAESDPEIMPNGKVGLRIKEIFGKDLPRFKVMGQPDYMNAAFVKDSFEGKFISKLNIGGRDIDIDALAKANGGAKNPKFLEAVAGFCKQAGNIAITIADASGNHDKTFVCERDARTVFVTKDCKQSGGRNAVYDPHVHGIAALQDCDKICNHAGRVFGKTAATAVTTT